MTEIKMNCVLNQEQGTALIITYSNDGNTRNKNCNALTTATKSN